MASNKSTNKKGKKGAINPAPSVSLATKSCVICEENIDECLQCKVCKNNYHHSCVDMPDDVFSSLLPILPTVGWVCEECIGLITVKRSTLKNDVDGLQTTVNRLEANFAALISRFDVLSGKIDSATKPLHATSMMNSHISTVSGGERRPATDDKRKFNVIVSGLAELDDDMQSIKDILRTALDLQPTIASCRRIGKVAPDRPRKLLVSFAHASARDDVLALAREKKLSTITGSRGIYINPDLSPSDSKAAYEARQSKKNQRNDNTAPLQVTLPPLSSVPVSDSHQGNQCPAQNK